MATDRHHISGYESWSADEIADLLSGDSVPVGDTEGFHGAVIVLARRVAEQKTEIDGLKRQHESANEALAVYAELQKKRNHQAEAAWEGK